MATKRQNRSGLWWNLLLAPLILAGAGIHGCVIVDGNSNDNADCATESSTNCPDNDNQNGGGGSDTTTDPACRVDSDCEPPDNCTPALCANGDCSMTSVCAEFDGACDTSTNECCFATCVEDADCDDGDPQTIDMCIYAEQTIPPDWGCSACYSFDEDELPEP